MSSSTVEAIEIIMDVHGCRQADMARAFGVSRAAVCKWTQDGSIDYLHKHRLLKLLEASMYLAQEGFSSMEIRRRVALDGKTVLCHIDPPAAAKKLCEILKSERTQRERMAKRFANRAASIITEDWSFSSTAIEQD